MIRSGRSSTLAGKLLPHTIAARLACVGGLAVLVAVALVLVPTWWTTRAALFERAMSRLDVNMRFLSYDVSRLGPVRLVNGQLWAGPVLLDGNLEIVDRVRTLAGGTATIFRGGVRVATNIANPDGTRAIGTVLASGVVRDTVLRDGRPYRGQADILGLPYYTAYEPLLDATGAVIGILYVGIPRAEFLSVLHHLQIMDLPLAGSAVLSSAALLLLMVRRTLQPLLLLNKTLLQLADGNIREAVPGLDQLDEVGTTARAVARLQGQLRQREHLESQRVTDAGLRDEQAERTGAAVIAFDAQVTQTLAELQEEASRLTAVSENLLVASDHTRTVAGSGHRASSQGLHEAKAMATAAEQLSQSVSEVAARVAHSAAIAVRAQDETRHMHDQVEGLSQAATHVGRAVVLIRKVAARTHLLSINATIEAAHAGEAGQGFSVVAREVKELAQLTAQATDEIGMEIEAIRNATGSVASGIAVVSATVAEMNDVTREVAVAARDQAMATTEIAQHVHQAVQEAAAVCASLERIDDGADVSTEKAVVVAGAAASLAGRSDTLRAQVDDFLGKVRAAA